MRPEDGVRSYTAGSSIASDVGQAQAHHSPEPAEAENRSGVQPYLSDQKKKLTQQLTDTAQALRDSGTRMPNDSSAGLIRISADTVEKVGRYLGGRDIEELIDDAQAYTRARPWWVIGGAFVAGMAAVRFLKSSEPSSRVHDKRSGRPGFRSGTAGPSATTA